MNKRRRDEAKTPKSVPEVSIVKPSDRPIQLRYFCSTAKRQIRISTGTRDQDEAERQKKLLEAKLLLGIETAPRRNILYGPEMAWEDFREQYRGMHLVTVRDSTAIHTESRLDIAEQIMKPRTLGDLAKPSALQQLQAKLLAGEKSRRGKPRSAHTVKGYLNSILGALNWAYTMDWLKVPPKLNKLKVGNQKVMKGRPITEPEFKQMLECTEGVVGEKAATSWKYLLRGLWESALRLDELMHVSWDDAEMIMPIWRKGQFPVLHIPSKMQKNGTDEEIPLLPGFEKVLQETPAELRVGWAFNPLSLQTRIGRKVQHHRPDAEWVGKVVAKIGKEAGIIVEPADERTGRKIKYASAHDLRRSCGERLRNAGIPPLVICRVMRHSSWETTRKYYAPGDIQADAQALQAMRS